MHYYFLRTHFWLLSQNNFLCIQDEWNLWNFQGETGFLLRDKNYISKEYFVLWSKRWQQSFVFSMAGNILYVVFWKLNKYLEKYTLCFRNTRNIPFPLLTLNVTQMSHLLEIQAKLNPNVSAVKSRKGLFIFYSFIWRFDCLFLKCPTNLFFSHWPFIIFCWVFPIAFEAVSLSVVRKQTWTGH